MLYHGFDLHDASIGLNGFYKNNLYYEEVVGYSSQILIGVM